MITLTVNMITLKSILNFQGDRGHPGVVYIHTPNIQHLLLMIY